MRQFLRGLRPRVMRIDHHEHVFSFSEGKPTGMSGIRVAHRCCLPAILLSTDSEARPGQAQQWMYHDDLC